MNFLSEQNLKQYHHSELSSALWETWQRGDWEALTHWDLPELTQHPQRHVYALLIGSAYCQLGQWDQAQQRFKQAEEWGASATWIDQILLAGVHNSFGRLQALASDSAKALRHFELACELEHRPHLSDVAQSRIAQQLHDLGLDVHQFTQLKTKGKNPHQRAAHLNQNGEQLYQSKQFHLAAEYFQRALDLDPNNAWICQNLAEAVARMEVKRGNPWDCEVLGELVEGTGKWDVAVRYYRKALRLNPAQVQEHQQQQKFEVAPLTENSIRNPIFIVGCGHSGTSIMLAILGNHPRLQPIPKESALFLRTDSTWNRTFVEWDTTTQQAGKERWIEKTPPHIFQLHRILAFRPEARILLMLRDGRDVVASLRHRRGYEDLQSRLDRWIYDNVAGLSYWDHPQVKVVRYENLVANPEVSLQSICEFLNEEYHPQLLDYHKTERRWYSDTVQKPQAIHNHSDHNTNRNWQINQPIFDGRGRWQAEMTEAEKEQFKSSPAQPLLEQFGYVTNRDW